MRLVEVKVEEIKRSKRSERKDTRLIFEEFMAMNVKAAEVKCTPNEYSSKFNMYASLRRSAVRREFPVKIRLSGDSVYLIREDL